MMQTKLLARVTFLKVAHCTRLDIATIYS